jgi:hypothetical protein
MIKLTARAFQTVAKRDRSAFPIYTKPILNIANQNSKATRAQVVGSLKDQWMEFIAARKRTVEEWEAWFMANDGSAKIEAATNKLYHMLCKMPIDHALFTRSLAEQYVLDLVINKTHYGMSGEYHSVLAAAKYFDLPYRFSTPEEESQGIDAWLGHHPVQVKPEDSVTMHHVRNHADTDRTLVITYEAKKDCCYILNPEFINAAS